MNDKRDWEVGTKVELTFGKLAGKKGTIVEINKRNVSVIVELESGMEVEEGMMYMKEITETHEVTEMTEKEVKVAEVIRQAMDSYEENFSDVDMYTLEAETGLAVKTIKGVLGSLDKKGFIFQEDVNGEENMFYLTKAGFKALTGEVPEYL